MQLLKKINKNRWVWTQDCWFVTLGYPNNNKKNTFSHCPSHRTTRAAVKQRWKTRQPASEEFFFWRGCPWWQTFDVFWLDSGGGDYQRLREINVLLIKRTWVGGRQTVLFMTGPVSALSRASQIPKTGKYFNCKHPWLDSLRGPPVRLFFFFSTCCYLLTYSPAWPKTSLHEYKPHTQTHTCTHCRHTIAATIIPQSSVRARSPVQNGDAYTKWYLHPTAAITNPLSSRLARTPPDASEPPGEERRGAVQWIPVINPRLHPVPLHQAS